MSNVAKQKTTVTLSGNETMICKLLDLLVCSNITILQSMSDLLKCVEQVYENGTPTYTCAKAIHVKCDHLKATLDEIVKLGMKINPECVGGEK